MVRFVPCPIHPHRILLGGPSERLLTVLLRCPDCGAEASGPESGVVIND